jgi:glycosyltransferase involved in cell wall biosynthesis
MKIYFYFADYAALDRPAQIGMEKAVLGLAKGLAAAGAEGAILCETDADRVLPIGPSTGTSTAWLVRSFANRAKRKHLSLAPTLRRFVAEQISPGDLVVLNGMFHPSVYQMSRLLRRRGIAYIVAPHDPYHQSVFIKNRILKLPYWHLLERPLLQQALAVQVLDRRHGDQLLSRAIDTTPLEILNGFDEAQVPPESELSWSTTGCPRLLFLGRMETVNKGLDLLLDAMALPGPQREVELTLLGPDGGDLASLQARAEHLNLNGAVRFVPPDFSVSAPILASRYDALVLPSRFEGFSMAAMEAMLAARPVVISRIAGLTPHVQAARCGFIVDATPQSIADGIAKLLAARNQWREMGLRGRRYVLENLCWRKIGANALAEYQHLLARAN